jgi:hypothetical protein
MKSRQKNYYFPPDFTHRCDAWCERHGYRESQVVMAGLMLMSQLTPSQREEAMAARLRWELDGYQSLNPPTPGPSGLTPLDGSGT